MRVSKAGTYSILTHIREIMSCGIGFFLSEHKYSYEWGVDPNMVKCCGENLNVKTAFSWALEPINLVRPPLQQLPQLIVEFNDYIALIRLTCKRVFLWGLTRMSNTHRSCVESFDKSIFDSGWRERERERKREKERGGDTRAVFLSPVRIFARPKDVSPPKLAFFLSNVISSTCSEGRGKKPERSPRWEDVTDISPDIDSLQHFSLTVTRDASFGNFFCRLNFF